MCDCIQMTNEELVNHNTRLTPMVQIFPDRVRVYVTIATEKIDNCKREGPICLAAAYCPFCGEKVDVETGQSPPV